MGPSLAGAEGSTWNQWSRTSWNQRLGSETHGFSQHLQVERLQLLAHLSVPMAEPSVKVGRLEELSVVPDRIKQVSFDLTTTGGATPTQGHTLPGRVLEAGVCAHLYRPVQSPLSCEVSCGPA